MTTGVEARKYRILGVLGQGGFGTVYRARLEVGHGFVKEVAVKLLKDPDVPEGVLRRFRDEARILGLIRDRAIVSVDPPTRIAGRWAVVMEFVDGASCRRIGRAQPRFPPGVVVEIVGEIARALDKVWRQPGHDGAPLELLHRDIKPSNIQVTPSGEVKILDFGIAKATFEHREAKTTHHIGGTPGYIAPERLHGIETPAGDVYSLGVFLHVMLTRRKPPPEWQLDAVAREADTMARTPGEGERLALLLAQEMVRADPDQRPTAREVERRCHSIRALCTEDPLLRDWAEEVIPALSELEPDELVGSVVTETLQAVPVGPDTVPIPPPTKTTETRTSMWSIVRGASVLAAGGTGLLVVGVLFGVLAIGVVGVLWLAPWAEQPGDIARSSSGVQPAPHTEQMTEHAPPEVDIDAPLPAADAAPARSAAVTRAPSPRVAPVPAQHQPEEVRPETTASEAPLPSSATFDVALTSIPMGAAVWVDDVRAGTTPLLGHPLREGAHDVRMTQGPHTITRRVHAGRRSPTRHVWRIEEDQWESGF